MGLDTGLKKRASLVNNDYFDRKHKGELDGIYKILCKELFSWDRPVPALSKLKPFKVEPSSPRTRIPTLGQDGLVGPAQWYASNSSHHMAGDLCYWSGILHPLHEPIVCSPLQIPCHFSSSPAQLHASQRTTYHALLNRRQIRSTTFS